MKKRTGVWLAVACFLLAAAMTAYSFWKEHRAAQLSEQLLAGMALPAITNVGKDVSPDSEEDMPIVTVDSADCVGTVEIPALGRCLPVLDRCTDDGLRAAPCVYTGSAYRDDMIIAAHNYNAHFGGLSRLRVGDEVIFTDMAGNVFRYQVKETQTIDGTDVAGMLSGRWDLTLFTCTPGGYARVAVRCVRTE